MKKRNIIYTGVYDFRLINLQSNEEMIFKCVQNIRDKENKIEIDYPFDHDFSEDSLYQLKYRLSTRESRETSGVESNEWVTTFIVDCCKFSHVERQVSNLTGLAVITFVFEKIKMNNNRRLK